MAATATTMATATATEKTEKGKGRSRPSLFRPVYMDHRVTLTPIELRDAAKDIDAYLTKKIRKRVEEECCIHGWVRGGSTQILGRSMGQAEHCRFTGDFLYTCKIRVLCYLPESGQIVDAQILKVNKGGAFALVVDNGRVTEAVRLFLPRDLHLGNQEYDALQEGQVVRGKILMSRFQAKDPFIQAVGTFEGMSMAEVTVPAKKGAFEPAMTPTEGRAATASESEETTSDNYNVVREEGGGFTISARKTPVTAAVRPLTESNRGAFMAAFQAAASAPAGASAPAPAPTLSVAAPAPAAPKSNLSAFLAAMAAGTAKAKAEGKTLATEERGSSSELTNTTTATTESTESTESTASAGGVGGLFGEESEAKKKSSSSEASVGGVGGLFGNAE